MMLLKMLRFILLRHALSPGLVLPPRNVSACGCPRMIFRTHPHGHRPLFCSSVTSTPTFLPTVIVRTRRCPQSQPGAGARVGSSQQDGDAQQQEAGPLLLPQLTRLHEAYHVRGEDAFPTCPTSLLNTA
jgi:hypothetical protein